MSTESEIKARLATEIKKRRHALHLSYEGLAATSGLSKGYIHQIENQSVARPSVATVSALARALDTTTSELIGEAEDDDGLIAKGYDLAIGKLQAGKPNRGNKNDR